MTLPKKGEILISWEPESGGAVARLYSEFGLIINIVAPAMTEETGMLILHDYLDELGYDGGDVRKNV